MYPTHEFRHEGFLAMVLAELHLRHVRVDWREFDEFMGTMKALAIGGLPPRGGPMRFLDAHPCPEGSVN
jgi:hypothetical protein